MAAVAAKAGTDIRMFGATTDTIAADAAAINAKAINAAIDSCHNAGGGTVTIPAGTWLTGEIIMLSNVELHLENGAKLKASRDHERHFPMQPRNHFRSLKDPGGWNALIYAADQENIAVTGQGVIDGDGRGKRGWLQNVPGDGNGRPKNILFISCKNIRIEDLIMRNSSMWNIHLLNCEDAHVRGLNIYNHCNGNNDGIDIDCCRRVTVSDCIMDSDDDGIVMKATGTADCRDISITNCIVSSYANAIKCGTETTGGYRNICISNCVITPSRSKDDRILKSTPTGITAISLEIVDGGTMDGVNIDNIIIQGTECPLYIRLANRARKHIAEAPEPGQGSMRNISITNIQATETGNWASSITGIPGAKVENVYIGNFRVRSRGGVAEGEYLKTADDVKEDEKGYPEPIVWKNLPAKGLFIRHADGIVIDNARFSSALPDPRPDIVTSDVTNIEYLNLSKKRR